jgi:hypothetical protein
MRVEHNITVSTIISGLMYTIIKSWELTIASFIAGIFIDLDHFIDYLIKHGLRFNTNEIYDFFYKEQHKKITLIFHCWELLIALAIAAKLTNFNPWFTGVLIGYRQHTITDYFFNKTSFWSYSLIMRWKIKFNPELVFPRNRDYNPKA